MYRFIDAVCSCGLFRIQYTLVERKISVSFSHAHKRKSQMHLMFLRRMFYTYELAMIQWKLFSDCVCVSKYIVYCI